MGGGGGGGRMQAGERGIAPAGPVCTWCLPSDSNCCALRIQNSAWVAFGRLDKAEDLSVSLPGVSMKRVESWTGRLAGVDPAGLIQLVTDSLLIQVSHQYVTRPERLSSC